MTVEQLIESALAEDIGSGDLTTALTVPENTQARALIAQKQEGVIFGLEVAERVFGGLDSAVRCERLCVEGKWRADGPVLAISGQARALLTAERTALNFLAHLSGIATLTARCVRELAGTDTVLLDTRKTTPGLRELEKAAVAAGGGHNHRHGLYDAMLIKENHIALAGGVVAAIERARAGSGELPLEVECRTRREVDEALTAGASRILLDNMIPEQLRNAVEYVAGRAELEASGGITLVNIQEYGQTGVDFISMGALTHSAGALDLSMTLE